MERLIAYALNMSVEHLIVVMIVVAIAYMFKRQNDLYYKYNALNTIVFALDKHTKLNGVKTGNSQGDFMLDWDGVPETSFKGDELMKAYVTWLEVKKQADAKKNKGTTVLNDL